MMRVLLPSDIDPTPDSGGERGMVRSVLFGALISTPIWGSLAAVVWWFA